MRFLPNRNPYGWQNSFSPLIDPRTYSGVFPDLSLSLIHHYTISFPLGRAWVTPLIHTFVSGWCKTLSLLWKLQSMKNRSHAEWGVAVPWGQVTLGWRCGWTKLICREISCHSCWFSTKTSPVSFGGQLLCDLSATWYHRLPIPARITAEPGCPVSTCSHLHCILLTLYTRLQAVLCRESLWDTFCTCQLHPIL